MNRNVLAGGAIWAGLAAASWWHIARLGIIELLFLLGPLVVVPLGLALSIQLTDQEQARNRIRLAQKFQLPAALCAALSFWPQPGKAAAILATVWLCFGAGLGLVGAIHLTSFLRGKSKNIRSACTIASFLYLPIGCAWLVASRLGLSPMDFQEPIVLLTAVHFHFAGFAAPLLAMAADSAVPHRGAIAGKLFHAVAAGVLAGPGLLAAGFVIGPRAKLAAALLVVCSEIGLSMFFFSSLCAVRPALAQAFLGISAASVSFAMVLAGIWAMGEYPLQPFVHLN